MKDWLEIAAGGLILVLLSAVGLVFVVAFTALLCLALASPVILIVWMLV